MPVWPQRQQGIALLTVLLVVFLATAAAVALLTTEQFAVQRSTLLLHRQQARLYALGAEQWAGAILARDLKNSPTDALDEDWAQIPPALPVEGGAISGRIEDLQGRFNLNDLLRQDSTTQTLVVDATQLDLLKRLLDNLDLSIGIAQAIADWIDPDQDLLFPDGAEDSEYLALEPAYLAANRPLHSITELRLIKGIDREAYAKLAPYVAALPLGTPLNVNTAAAPLRAALAKDSNNRSTTERDDVDEPFESVDDFLQVTGLTAADVAPERLTVASRYFLARLTVEIGDSRVQLSSVLERSTEGVRVLARHFGAYE